MSKPAFFKYLCLAFAFSGCLHAQNCDNLDFARGNFNGWTGKSWIYTVYPDWYTNTLPVTGTANGRFAIMKDTTAYDVNTGDALKIIPKGYKYVARLGNDASGCNRQSLSYKINVDQQNALLVWRFAVIMEDPTLKHTEETRPFFNISLKNNAGQSISTCTDYSVISSPELTGFHTYIPPGYIPDDSLSQDPIVPIRWRDWTSVGINLSSYIGQEVTLELTTADCAQGGHYCYAYVTAECLPLHIVVDYCKDDTIAVLSAPEGFISYKWLTPDNQIIETPTLRLKNPVEGQEYQCTFTSEMGCTASLKTKVYRFNPTINFSGSQPDCDLNIVHFNNLSTVNDGDLTYKWDFGNGKTSAERNPVFQFDTVGYHPVTLTIGNTYTKCTTTLTKYIESFSASSVKITGDTTFCPGYGVALKASGAAHYLWNTGDTTAVIEAKQEKMYSVTGYSPGRTCWSSPVNFRVKQEPDWLVSFSGAKFFCEGDSTVIVVSGGKSYRWENGNTSEKNIIRVPGKYSVIATNNRGCEKTAEINISMVPYPLSGISASVAMIDAKHNSVVFQSVNQPGIEYMWDFGDGNTATGNSVHHNFTVTGDQPQFQVVLKAVNENGCTTENSTIIETQPFIPNVFTPNNDGKNELFMAGYDMKVYDRQGIQVFTGNAGWDGKYNAKSLPPDTYFYVITYLDNQMATQVRKGYVMLLR